MICTDDYMIGAGYQICRRRRRNRMSDINDFVIENGVLKKYTGPGGEVMTPEGVMEIGEAFSHCMDIESVFVSNGVTEIGTAAFMWCRNLTYVFIPDGVTIIGSMAFCGCESLKIVDIPDSVTYISEDAFPVCPYLRIVAPRGSYAEKYARDHKIKFVAEEEV